MGIRGMRTALPTIAAGALLLLALTACQSPSGDAADGDDTSADDAAGTSTSTEDGAPEAPSDAATAATSPGWIVTATGMGAAWLPRSICGGDWMFGEGAGFGLGTTEDLTDLNGVTHLTAGGGPLLYVSHDDGPWTYFYDANDLPETAGTPYQTTGEFPDLVPGSGANPPPDVTSVNDRGNVWQADGTWQWETGLPPVTLHFEPGPAPAGWDC